LAEGELSVIIAAGLFIGEMPFGWIKLKADVEIMVFVVVLVVTVWCTSSSSRVAANLESLEYSGISLNVENSGNSRGILCDLREKL